MEKTEKKADILQKWAKSCKIRPDYPDLLRTLLQQTTKDFFVKKHPEKVLEPKEKVFGKFIPINPELSKYYAFPLDYEEKILEIAIKPQLKLPINDVETLETFEQDLRGKVCPGASVSARLLLSTLPKGTRVSILLDGLAAENVPGSLVADGHIVEKREKKAGFWKILVLKQN